MLIITAMILAAAPDASHAAEGAKKHQTTWVGSSHQPQPPYNPEYEKNLLVPSWIRGLAVTPDGDVYMAGGSEAHGLAAFRYDPNAERVRIIGRYNGGSVGSPASEGCAVDDEYFYTTHKHHGLIRSPRLPGPGEHEVDRDAVFEVKAPYPVWPEGELSARWTGTIEIPASGEYRFGLRHFDVVRMWIDDEKVIEYPHNVWAFTHFSRRKQYDAGEKLEVRIDYATKRNRPRIELYWQRPDGVVAEVPASVLRTPEGKPGLHGRYFADAEFGELAFERVDPYLRFYDRRYPTRAFVGMAIHDGELYASDVTFARICVFNLKTLKMTRSWNVDFRPGELAIDRSPQGGPCLWVADPAGQKVRSFTLAGELRDQTVTGVAKPVTLAFDKRNRLWVGDNGPDMQIKIFEIADGSPKQVDTFGEQGGVWSGKPGSMGPLRFRKFRGLDIDRWGNIYLACDYSLYGGGRTSIECYRPDGERLWQAYKHAYVDGAVIDPDDESRVYTSRQVLRVDWTKPVQPTRPIMGLADLERRRRRPDLARRSGRVQGLQRVLAQKHRDRRRGRQHLVPPGQ
jgi:hypothetical protein